MAHNFTSKTIILVDEQWGKKQVVFSFQIFLDSTLHIEFSNTCMEH